MASIRPLVCWLVLGLAIGACSQASPGAEPFQGKPTPVPSSASPPQRIGLSLEDDGKTIAVDRSSKVTLVLGQRYRWTHPTTDGAAVEVSALLSDDAEGAQMWELTLVGTGTVVLRSVGSPACRPTTPGCPESELAYVVTLEIGG